MIRTVNRALLVAPVLAMLSLVAQPVVAQDEAAIRQGLAITRADIQADRKAIVAASLELSESQAKAFWPMYDAYRADMSVLADRTQEIVLSYAKQWNSASLTDASATSLHDRWMSLREDEVATQKRWAKKLRQQMPGIVVARFFQIENRLDLIVRAEMASEIPLMQKIGQ